MNRELRTKLVPSLTCLEPGVYPEPAEGKGKVEGNYYMQNKPNFQKCKMNITSALAKDYENIPPAEKCQNKPNFIRHSLVAFVAASAKKAGEGGQTQFLYHWFCLLIIIAAKYRELIGNYVYEYN